jgi:integrase
MLTLPAPLPPMPLPPEEETLRAWMVARDYAQRTILGTLVDLRTAQRLVQAGKTNARLRPTLRRVEACAEDLDNDALRALAGKLSPAVPPVKAAHRFGGRAKPKLGREARSFTDEDWERLRGALGTTPPELALGVMVATGLRVGDVLRLSRATLLEAQGSGEVVLKLKGGVEVRQRLDGAPEAWAALLGPFLRSGAHDVGHWISPQTRSESGANGAYQAMRRALKRVCADAGITEEAWTHRIRRTVGVRAYRVTEDVLAVRDLLGHRRAVTTETYLSEARPDRVAALQQKIRGEL